MVWAGALRKRLTLQSESLASDGSGGYVASWNTVTTLWGQIEALAGSAPVTSSADKRLTHKIIIRYRTDITITTGMRLVDGSRIFTVRGVVNLDEANRWYELQAEADGLLG